MTDRGAASGMLLVMLFAPGLDAATEDAPRRRGREARSVLVQLRGRVIDEQTRTPLEGAFVAQAGSMGGVVRSINGSHCPFNKRSTDFNA